MQYVSQKQVYRPVYIEYVSQKQVYRPEYIEYVSQEQVYRPEYIEYVSQKQVYRPESIEYASQKQVYRPEYIEYASQKQIYKPYSTQGRVPFMKQYPQNMPHRNKYKDLTQHKIEFLLSSRIHRICLIETSLQNSLNTRLDSFYAAVPKEYELFHFIEQNPMNIPWN